jgi:hypothetical protein
MPLRGCVITLGDATGREAHVNLERHSHKKENPYVYLTQNRSDWISQPTGLCGIFDYGFFG